MIAHGLTPILNVSNMEESFAWFAKLGWQKIWDWGDPPDFGAVRSGVSEIFLCLDGQGERRRSRPARPTGVVPPFSEDGQGVWMSVWVADVDAVHRECLDQEIEIIMPPRDMEWNVREMHIRHPDGHVFRIGRGIPEE